MFKKLLNKKLVKNEKGLTLIELLAVIVILAIVAAIAVPAIGGIIDNSRFKAAKSDAIMALNSANIYFTDTPTDSAGDEIKDVTLETLVAEGYVETTGTLDEAAGANAKNVVIVKDVGGNKISGTATAGKYRITFNSATLEQISEDNQKVKSAGAGEGNTKAVSISDK